MRHWLKKTYHLGWNSEDQSFREEKRLRMGFVEAGKQRLVQREHPSFKQRQNPSYDLIDTVVVQGTSPRRIRPKHFDH